MEKFKDLNSKIESAVVGSYKKIEDSVVENYKKLEEAAVEGYKKVEDVFIDALFSKVGETTEETRARLRGENKSKEEHK